MKYVRQEYSSTAGGTPVKFQRCHPDYTQTRGFEASQVYEIAFRLLVRPRSWNREINGRLVHTILKKHHVFLAHHHVVLFTSFVIFPFTLQWRHNERDGISNHRCLYCLLNFFQAHRWPVDSPHKRASNAENISIWWRHYNVTLMMSFWGYLRHWLHRELLLFFKTTHFVASYHWNRKKLWRKFRHLLHCKL